MDNMHLAGQIHALKYMAGTALTALIQALPEKDRAVLAQTVKEQIDDTINISSRHPSYSEGMRDIFDPTLRALNEYLESGER